MNSLKTGRIGAFAGAAFGACLVAVAATAASAHPAAKSANGRPHAGAVKVHQEWRDEDVRGRHHSRRRHAEVVDAPYTHVEAGRRVVVDAPYAHVYAGRRGRHIVAPFVDLWVDR